MMSVALFAMVIFFRLINRAVRSKDGSSFRHLRMAK